MSLIGCGTTGQLPAGQASQASLLLGQAKKNHCTKPCVYVTNQLSNTVTIYPAKPKGNVAPAGSLGGPNTDIDYPTGLAFDTANNIYVANYRSSGGFGSVTVYPAGSRGNVAPIAEIAGIDSGDRMIYPSDVVLDAAGGIYVSGYASNSVSVYAPGASGDPTPIRYISAATRTSMNPATCTLRQKESCTYQISAAKA